MKWPYIDTGAMTSKLYVSKIEKATDERGGQEIATTLPVGSYRAGIELMEVVQKDGAVIWKYEIVTRELPVMDFSIPFGNLVFTINNNVLVYPQSIKRLMNSNILIKAERNESHAGS